MNLNSTSTTTYTATAGLDITSRGNVLSVNPGRSTLGHLNALEAFGANVRMPRVAVLNERHDAEESSSLAGILFPVKQMNLAGSIILLIVRITFAVFLIHGGIADLAGSSAVWGWSQIALGAFVAMGLLTRALMVVPAVAFAMLAAASPELLAAAEPAAFALVSVLLLVVGSGWLSADALIRVAIRRHNAKHRAHGYILHRSLTPDYPLANLQTPE